MKYLLLSFLIFSTQVMSNEKKIISQVTKKPTVDTGKTLDIDPTGKTREIVDETTLYTQEHGMKAKVSCKTKEGKELKQGDKGYEECLKAHPEADVKVEFEKK